LAIIAESGIACLYGSIQCRLGAEFFHLWIYSFKANEAIGLYQDKQSSDVLLKDYDCDSDEDIIVEDQTRITRL
jgi:hypothetical protein